MESAYCIIDSETYKPEAFSKMENDRLLGFMQANSIGYDKVIIEMVASYGMAVGKEVFETCVMIGQIKQKAIENDIFVDFIYRKDEKMNLCQSMRAKDSNIRQALIDRFGVVGTKKNPGWFYGFKKDIWSAYAVGVTYCDTYLQKQTQT